MLLQECHDSGGPEAALREQPERPAPGPRAQRLCSIPEVAEEDAERSELGRRQGIGHPRAARGPRPLPSPANQALPGSRFPAEPWGPAAGPHAEDSVLEDRGSRSGRWATRSPDSGLDCGSDEELRSGSGNAAAKRSAGPGLCPCRSLRPLLARRRTLTRQSSIEEDFGEQVDPSDVIRSDDAHPSPEGPAPRKYGWDEPAGPEDLRDVWKKSVKAPGSRAAAQHTWAPSRVADGPLVCEVTPSRLLARPTRFHPSFYAFILVPSLGTLLAVFSFPCSFDLLGPIASQPLNMLKICLLCFRIMITPQSAMIMAALIKGQLNLNFN